MKKYIAKDCYGVALKFSGSGRSVQCDAAEADQFDRRPDAERALKRAEEAGGWVEGLESSPRRVTLKKSKTS